MALQCNKWRLTNGTLHTITPNKWAPIGNGYRKAKAADIGKKTANGGTRLSMPKARVSMADSFNPARRALLPQWNRGGANRCLSCGGSHWHVGRTMAECGSCSAPVALGGDPGPSTISIRVRGGPWRPAQWSRGVAA